EIMQTPQATGDLENDAIGKLVESYLVREDKRRGNTWYELAHDSLIKPILTSNADWLEKHLHPMQRQAALWEREGRPDELLLRGKSLEDALRWAREYSAMLLPVEKALLERSTRHRGRQNARSLIALVGSLAWMALTIFAVISWRTAVSER